MDPQLQELLTSLAALVAEVKGVGWGWAGAVGALVGLIRIWRTPFAQGWLAAVIVKRWPRLRFLLWSELPPLAQFLLPFVGALLGGLGAVAAGALTWQAAFVGAVGVGLASIATHHGTKAVGSALTPVVEAMHPSVSRPMSLVFPIDPSRIPSDEPPAG